MKLFIIRALLITLLYVVFRFMLRQPDALLIAFVLEYIFEPLISQYLK